MKIIKSWQHFDDKPFIKICVDVSDSPTRKPSSFSYIDLESPKLETGKVANKTSFPYLCQQ